jgi:hypothetical protein
MGGNQRNSIARKMNQISHDSTGPRFLRTSHPKLFTVVLWISLSLTAFAAEEFASEVIRNRLKVPPIPTNSARAASELAHRNDPGAKGGNNHPIFQRQDDGAWTTYRDDLVSFELPDDPAISVKRLSPGRGEMVQVDTGTYYGEPGSHYSYRISVDGSDYLSVALLQKEPFHVQSGFWGMMASCRWIAADGNVLRFGFLSDGRIQLAEAIGATYQAVLPSWSGSKLTQDAYARIARSLRLRVGNTLTETDSIRELRKADSPSQLFDWLVAGDDATRVREVAGEPTGINGDTWTYHKEKRKPTGGGDEWTVQLEIKEGRFERVLVDSSSELPPTPGSADSFFGAEPITDVLARSIFDAFLKDPKRDEFGVWDRWMDVLGSVSFEGFQDPRVTEVVKTTFLDPKRIQGPGAFILDRSKVEGRRELYIQRINLLLDSPDAHDRALFREMGGLLELIGTTDPVTVDIMRKALTHSNAKSRGFGVYHAKQFLPPDEARKAILNGLNDGDRFVRQTTARSLTEIATPADLPALKRALELVDDVRTVSLLKVIINAYEHAAKSGN